MLSSLSATTTSNTIIEDLSIEYCPGCRWITKSFWMATELLGEYPIESLEGVTIAPSDSGTFRITATTSTSRSTEGKEDVHKDSSSNNNAVLLWDRRVDGGFPPIDLVAFDERVRAFLDGSLDVTVEDGVEDHDGRDTNDEGGDVSDDSNGATVAIRYCPGSGYLLRAAYYGQELLTTFCGGEIRSVTLAPVPGATKSGNFSVELSLPGGSGDGSEPQKARVSLLLWDVLSSAGFPEVKKLKQLVRDSVTPEKDLGHSDGAHGSDKATGNVVAAEEEARDEKKITVGTGVDDLGECIPCNDVAAENNNEEGNEDEDDEFMDDDEAEEARRFFGVM